ncbi:uncharacterized protein LTR77_003438 [Saxophila tyrrhenica]|uniref:Uncharacterized protein n=1 Tax=Saxophila tyrrhenica TaxID=1690608 RepID=A0AAV9PEZ0_9PEZI|nr:hypothetical protein LTR77_003438 [Saxophila tyrrhenica]
MQGGHTYRQHEADLCLLLGNVEQSVRDLDSKIEYHLRASEGVDEHGRPKVSKRAWLMAASKIEHLRQNIRDARDNLTAALMVLGPQTTRDVFGTIAIQTQDFRTLSSEHMLDAGSRAPTRQRPPEQVQSLANQVERFCIAEDDEDENSSPTPGCAAPLKSFERSCIWSI